ncbi:MAG: choice-of-anchor B family protein, partial [Aliifodinibius sp.]|nr:choice-of-anchor B family protein [Fodinibius sp.]NIY25882.1 choice-of-anchor B family protein [Fodinibius sp.]
MADTEYVEVEIRFDSGDTTLCQTYRRDLGFPYPAAGVGVFRGSAWDISDPNNPRRLNICFLEDNNLKPANLLWDPDDSFFGSREYLFIMLSDYDGTGTTYDDVNWGPGADVVYGWWPKLEAGHPFFETDPATLSIKFAFIRNFRALPDDGKLILSWAFDEPGADHLNLYFGISSPPTNLLTSLSTTTQTYEHTGLANQTTYFYRMEAVNSNGDVLYVSPEISAQPQVVSQNVNLLGFWHQRRRYGDIWGYMDQTTGREYALLCARNEGFSIIDITDPTPVEVGFAPGINPGVDSKDVKVYGHHAILINEFAPVQIFDLSDPANPNLISTIDFSAHGYTGGAHNCYVDGNYLYIVGNHGPGGLLIYDISTPSSPSFEGGFQPYYYHDIYVRNDTAYAAAIYGQGVDIIDVSNKVQPALITTFNYPGSGAHNCWTTEDGKYIFVGDEIGSLGNHTRVFNIQNLSNVTKVADIIIDPNAITHNSYVKGNTLYIGHYTEGVRFFDVSDPTSPQEMGYYDTFVPQEYGFDGCWSVYPYFQSEKIIASDMSTGLYA